MAANYEIDMTNGPIMGKIIKFTIPLALSNMLQLFYNAADMIVVGNFAGSDALAAVSATTTIITLFVNFFIGLSVGTNILLSQRLGAGEKKDIYQITHTAITMSVVFGIILAVASIWFVKPVLKATGTPKEILHLSEIYLKIYFFGSPANILYNYGSAILKATGDTKRPLRFLAISGIINVGLNLILVTVFHLGTAGVAIATVTSQFVSASLVVITLVRSEGYCHIDIKKLRIYPQKMVKLLSLGFPSSIQGVLFHVSSLLIQSSINSFGTDAIAGSGAAANIENFVYLSISAFGQAALIFTGHNYGAGKLKRVTETMVTCIFLSSIAWVIEALVILIFRIPLLKIFIPTNKVALSFGVKRLFVIVGSTFLCGVYETSSGVLKGLGRSALSAAVCLMGACVFRVLWIYTVFTEIHTFECLMASYPISWLLLIIVMYICYAFIYRKLNAQKKFAE